MRVVGRRVTYIDGRKKYSYWLQVCVVNYIYDAQILHVQ